MLHTILPTQMQAAEQTAFAAGLSPLLTMETAARAAFDVLLDLLGCDCRGKNVLFLCGPGNNGGDGLVMARLLLQARGFARIILLDTPKTAEAQINLRHLQAMGADIEAVPDELLEDEYDAVVDALFGTGFTGSIAADSPAGRLLTWANTCGPMLSIDVPSGMDAATGAGAGGQSARSPSTARSAAGTRASAATAWARSRWRPSGCRGSLTRRAGCW